MIGGADGRIREGRQVFFLQNLRESYNGTAVGCVRVDAGNPL